MSSLLSVIGLKYEDDESEGEESMDELEGEEEEDNGE